MRGPNLSSHWREAAALAGGPHRPRGRRARARPDLPGDGMADGRGRPVLLIPGFLAGDGSLSMMAGWLKRAGYRPSRAGIASNVELRGG